MKLTGDRCLCRACGGYFNSTKAFDRHRRGGYAARRCLTEAEMLAAGMSHNAAGFWITSKRQVIEVPAYLRKSPNLHPGEGQTQAIGLSPSVDSGVSQT